MFQGWHYQKDDSDSKSSSLHKGNRSIATSKSLSYLGFGGFYVGFSKEIYKLHRANSVCLLRPQC